MILAAPTTAVVIRSLKCLVRWGSGAGDDVESVETPHRRVWSDDHGVEWICSVVLAPIEFFNGRHVAGY